MKNYKVDVTVEGSLSVEIEDCWDEEEATEALEDFLQNANYGKLYNIEDFIYSNEEAVTAIYDDLGWDDEKGYGEGSVRIVGCLAFEVSANSIDEAIEKANQYIDNSIKDKKIYGDVDYVSLQTEIGLGNIIEKEKQIERE